jgi:hypothetical protein
MEFIEKVRFIFAVHFEIRREYKKTQSSQSIDFIILCALCVMSLSFLC